MEKGETMAGIATLMATDMITATPEETVAAVASRMSANKIGAVLVITEDDRIGGVFSERDLLVRVAAAGRDPKATRVHEVATQAVVTIDVEAPLKDVLALFRKNRFRHVPVVRGGKPVGILSTRDFLEYLVDGFEHYIDEFRYNRALAEGTDPYDHFGGQYGR
jgi:CBS domain-containing protein